MTVGRTIGKYRILEVIGRGGMGTVYKAVDETLDRVVAIKMINADVMTPERMQRFRSEAVALARLNHPRIATIHELAREAEDLLMVMEYVTGETCEHLVVRNGALPVARAVMLCDQVLDALEHAHSAGIVHRDLKPSNLMVTPNGDVKVMDFGIARIAGSEHLTTDGYMMGTPAYMAPEQVRGSEVDARMDLYAVAVVLYRLLTNHLPFRADSPFALIQSQLMDEPTPARQIRPDLPEWLDEILSRGLAKAPDDRVQTAAEFRLALQRGLSGNPGTGSVPPPWLDSTSAETYAGPTPLGMRSPPSHLVPVYSGPTPVSAVPTIPAPPVPRTEATAAPASTIPRMDTTAPAPPAPRTDATVTLRKPHLALVGVLLGLLVVGVAVLAYEVFRRPALPTAGPAVADAIAPSPAPTPAVDPTQATASTPPPAPDVPPAPAASLGSSAVTPPTGAAPAATTAARGNSDVRGSGDARGSAARGGGDAAAKTPGASPATGAALGSKDAAPAARSGNPAARPAPVPGSPPTNADAGGRGGAEPPPPPVGTTAAAAAAPTESFGAVKALLPPSGDATKSREMDALLSLEPGELVVRSRDSGEVLKTVPYRTIAAATYTRARRPKASDSSTVTPVPENIGGSGFLGTAKHWLTLQSKSDFLILRLDDKNVLRVMSSLESRTGVKTERPDQAK